MTGIIDVGSNTIRLVIYDGANHISNSGLNSEIINDTENGSLTESGIKKLINAIAFLKEKAGDTKILAFGTYAMRVLNNKDEVRLKVFEATGVNIDILSGIQEAEYDFYGLLETIDSNESGIGVDLGGGSAQVLIFENGKQKIFKSCPIGCKKIKSKFVSGHNVTAAETEKISNYIKYNLHNLQGNKTEKIYMMGGTAKTALKLYNILTNSDNSIIEISKIPELLDFIKNSPQKIVKNILKYRYDTVVCGIIIMSEIAKYFGAEKIHIKKCGVRDGYMYKNQEK